MSNQDQSVLLVVEQLKEQNRINDKQAENIGKLADKVGELATKIEVSLEKHDHTETRMDNMEIRQGVTEKYIESARPVIERSKWWQDALSDFAKTKLIPIILLAALAGLGFNFYSVDKPKQEQKQEQTK